MFPRSVRNMSYGGASQRQRACSSKCRRTFFSAKPHRSNSAKNPWPSPPWHRNRRKARSKCRMTLKTRRPRASFEALLSHHGSNPPAMVRMLYVGCKTYAQAGQKQFPFWRCPRCNAGDNFATRRRCIMCVGGVEHTIAQRTAELEKQIAQNRKHEGSESEPPAEGQSELIAKIKSSVAGVSARVCS